MNGEDQAPPQDPLDVGAPPPVTAGGRESRAVVPRRVTGRVAPEIAEYVKPELMPSTLGGRPARSPIERQVAGAVYTGEALMDNRGNITRMPYDPVRETLNELGKLETTERLALLNELYQRGMYQGGSRPSANGTSKPDLDAMSELLQASNVYGYEWKTALALIRADYPSSRSGRGGRRGTPVADIRKSVDQQALEALGRRFTGEEVSGLIAQIQGREAGGDRTSLGTMSEQVVAGAAQDEQTAYRFTQVADLFNDMLRSGR